MSEHFCPFLIAWEQKRRISGLCFINRLFISPRIRFVCLQSYLLLITSQQLLEMSILPQQSGSSWWAQSALVCHGICLCCVAEQQDIVASSQQVRGLPLLDLLPFAPVFMWVYGKAHMPECSRITPICQQPALLNLKCAHGEQQPRTNQASICLHFVHCASFTIHKKSSYPITF